MPGLIVQLTALVAWPPESAVNCWVPVANRFWLEGERVRFWTVLETWRFTGAVAVFVVSRTLVALMVRNGHFACLWAGDSRAYLLRGGVMQQITRDHSLVQELVDNGTITEAEAENHPHANVITRAVGADVDDLVLDKVSGRLQQGDKFLLCSDGLCKTVPFARIEELLRGGHSARVPTSLIAEALALSVTDNVTVVTVEVPDLTA